MLTVLRMSWPLLLGVMLLLLGNGIQGTLLGIRGKLEGFSAVEMSYVMSAYYAGFLVGSRLAPEMIRSVGHVRVFAALGSLISAALVAYPVAPDWMIWALLRVLIGFSFAGVYITAESWLNASSTNETRGQALSAYMIMQMLGIILAQLVVNLRDPGKFDLFAISSILVSISFTPILLAATPAPAFDRIKPLPIGLLFRTSPLGCVGIFIIGGVFSAQFGMAAVWGAEVGLSVGNISAFIAATYLGGLVLQFPIGWLSDRYDRRSIILALAAAGVFTMVLAVTLPWTLPALMLVGFLSGGISNPVYSLLVAYVNDYLDGSEMAGASAGLMFINGLGAIGGPLTAGWFMHLAGPRGYFLFMLVLFAALTLYTSWRMTQRRAQALFRGRFRTLSPTASAVAVEAAIESRIEDLPPDPAVQTDR